MSERPVPPYLAASATAKDRCLPCQRVYFPCRLASIKSRPCCLPPSPTPFLFFAFVCLPECVCVCERVHSPILPMWVCRCLCESLRYFISTRLHMIIKPWGAGREGRWVTALSNSAPPPFPNPVFLCLLTGLP